MVQQQTPTEPPLVRSRRTLRTTAAVIGAIAVLVTIGVIATNAIYDRVAAPGAEKTAAAAPTTHRVVYEADGGDARGIRSANITLRTDNGGTQQASINLPLKTKAGDVGLAFDGFRSGDHVYLSVQNQDAGGSVTCRIVVDGVTISENTSTGGYVIATCSSRVP